MTQKEKIPNQLYIKVTDSQWYATDPKGKHLTAQQTAQAIAKGATYKFVGPNV